MLRNIFDNAISSVDNAKMCIQKEIEIIEKIVFIDDLTTNGKIDNAGSAARDVYEGELQLRSQDQVLQTLETHYNGTQTNNLIFIDHGNKNGIYIGDEFISMDNLDENLDFFRELSVFVNPEDGIVNFQHCQAGQNTEFFQKIAATMGVPILTSAGYHQPELNINVSGYILYQPDGTVLTGSEAKEYKIDLRDSSPFDLKNMFKNPF